MREKENRTNRSTFAQDTKISPRIIDLVASVSQRTITSLRDREKISDKYFEALEQALEDLGDDQQ